MNSTNKQTDRKTITWRQTQIHELNQQTNRQTITWRQTQIHELNQQTNKQTDKEVESHQQEEEKVPAVEDVF